MWFGWWPAIDYLLCRKLLRYWLSRQTPANSTKKGYRSPPVNKCKKYYYPIDNLTAIRYIGVCGIAQLVERRSHKPDVLGSIPSPRNQQRKTATVHSGAVFLFRPTRLRIWNVLSFVDLPIWRISGESVGCLDCGCELVFLDVVSKTAGCRL